jgi:hypothetical protein
LVQKPRGNARQKKGGLFEPPFFVSLWILLPGVYRSMMVRSNPLLLFTISSSAIIVSVF